ncbi:MAG: cytochrome BD quinol oxidase subunit I [Phycisphaera sp.]|nr:cytochrome BD quinol oxidase subunit I [Phycisphaera sp.]
MTYYPLNDFGPVMKGMVIGGLGIFHVFLAQFAIGGGMLMCYLQWLAMRRPKVTSPAIDPHSQLFRAFLDSYFKTLVLISFVLGALTGVAMWFTTIQVSARTIGVMVDEFHWIWATEWTFFCLEIVSGYTFYRYGKGLTDRARMTLLVLYSIAAWFSLFWINGILSWQLTPALGQPGSLWANFFNPSFWPSLFFRTVVSMTIAALAGCVVVNTMSEIGREERTVLINRMAHFLGAMVVMPLLAWWYFSVIPADSRQWVMGGSIAMTLFFMVSAGASLLIGGYAVMALIKQRLYINGATATLLLALAFAATGGGEFVREGVRKPYTIRGALYSNSIVPDEVAHLRNVGLTTDDPYPLRDAQAYPNNQLRLGAMVFRDQCSVCHTMDGANALVHLAGSWTLDQKRLNFAKLQHLKTFMPPFVGNAHELEAVVQLVTWNADNRPTDWPDTSQTAPFTEIERYLEQAGTGSGLSTLPPHTNSADRLTRAATGPQ